MLVRAASSGTESESDLTYAVLADFSLAEVPAQPQPGRQRSAEWPSPGEPPQAQSSHPSASNKLTTNLVFEQPEWPPLQADLDAPPSFTFSRHNSGAEVALGSVIFGSGQFGGVPAEARSGLHTAQPSPTSLRGAADNTPAAISMHTGKTPLVLGERNIGMQLVAGGDQQSMQAVPVASLSTRIAVSTAQGEQALEDRDPADASPATVADVDVSESALNPFLVRTEAASSGEPGDMQDMRLSDNGEEQHYETPRSSSSYEPPPSGRLVPLRAAKSGIARFGSNTGLAMGRMGLLSRSAAGQLARNMAKTTAKPNAVSIVRHSSDSAAQPATPISQALLLEEVVRSYGVGDGPQAADTGAAADSRPAAAPYDITSPRQIDEALKLRVLTGAVERDGNKSSGAWAAEDELLLTTHFSTSAKRYSDVDPRQIRALSGKLKAYRSSGGEST